MIANKSWNKMDKHDSQIIVLTIKFKSLEKEVKKDENNCKKK